MESTAYSAYFPTETEEIRGFCVPITKERLKYVHLPADFGIFSGLPQNPNLHCECQPFSEGVFLSRKFSFG